MRARSAHYPVVIIGAGPTGLTLANLLAQHGLHHLLVERNPSTVGEPRAVSIDDESLRTMQAAGIIDTVLRDVVPGYGSIYYTSRKVPFAKVLPNDAPYGYPRRNAFRQPILEQQLLSALRACAASTQLFGWQLTTFDQTEAQVEVHLCSSDGQQRQSITCDYLVGCDGAASRVRARLGTSLMGTTYARRWLILDLDNAENLSPHTEVYCSPSRPCITLPGPHRTRRYEFELFPHESDEHMLAPERIDQLLKAHGSDPGAVLRRKAVYRFHARVAREWSRGRVFLAGDAAHLSPPFAGQGMNSGIRDAHNLAWKLALVAGGAMGAGLLQTYEQERADHVRQMIRLALRMGKVMSPANRWSALLTQTAFRLANALPWARDYVGQMKYKPKPRFTFGFMVPDGRARGHSWIGRLAPQPTVLRNGQRVLLDDVLGSGFALLARTSDPQTMFAALASPIWDKLGARRVAVLPTPVAYAQHDGGVSVSEVDDALARTLKHDSASVLLLRPDRYIAACFPLSQAEAAARAVETLCEQTWASRSVPCPHRLIA